MTKERLPEPVKKKNSDEHPSVFDISRFIKSYLPMGLYGVDDNG